MRGEFGEVAEVDGGKHAVVIRGRCITLFPMKAKRIHEDASFCRKQGFIHGEGQCPHIE